VEKEVEAVHMESVDKELKNIKTFLSDNPVGIGVDGPLPKIRFITHSQNHRFFGRQGLLTDLHSVLSRSGNTAQRRYVLYGVGGSGKTQIATQYSYQSLNDYQAVIWILADSSGKIQ
jgi:hypothetical protein